MRVNLRAKQTIVHTNLYRGLSSASLAMLQPLESPVLALYKLHYLECASWSYRNLTLYKEIRSLHLI
jgi:hypothetical protein